MKNVTAENVNVRLRELWKAVRELGEVRDSTPGGIIVLPHGENINSFTPVQHPANDMTTDIITTHFDYHSIDHNLLKLDILGHDDPTIIRMLEDLITDITGEKFDANKYRLMTLMLWRFLRGRSFRELSPKILAVVR